MPVKFHRAFILASLAAWAFAVPALASNFAAMDRGTVAPVVQAAGEYDRRVRSLSREQEASLPAGAAFQECAVCPTMVVVPAGVFEMGAPSHEAGSDPSERPQRQIAIARPLAVGRFAVTFAEWDACVADGGCDGYRPEDQGWGRGLQPVINVSWHDAQAYVRWLSHKTGNPYRLLSEAEREYAARASTDTPFWWGKEATTDRANYNGDRIYNAGKPGLFRGRPVPVNSFEPNPWGLYQMHGNVFDWTEDCENPDHRDAWENGAARREGRCHLRMIRGGSWSLAPNVMRSASRLLCGAEMRLHYVGFRVARTLHGSGPQLRKWP